MSLDPETDPLASILAIDFYALRSGEYRWFLHFCKIWRDSISLIELPNIAYGIALALFRLGQRQAAGELLEKALYHFPGVLIPLLNKCEVSPAKRVSWQSTKEETFV